jgi:hypothetical protein
MDCSNGPWVAGPRNSVDGLSLNILPRKVANERRLAIHFIRSLETVPHSVKSTGWIKPSGTII